MAKCSGITQAGTSCRGIPIDRSQWYYVHHPDHAEERRRHGSKGGKRAGRGRPRAETIAIKALLEDLTERVLDGDLPTGPAAVANQLINTRLRAIEQERKNRETEDLEARIGALERTHEREKRRRRGGEPRRAGKAGSAPGDPAGAREAAGYVPNTGRGPRPGRGDSKASDSAPR